MGASTCYWFVLMIYATLWGCQMFVCHSTHSLIVLTDSYINLYYIIEIVLELFYLRVQSKIIACKGDENSGSTYRILGRTCTYQFKRMPLLGTFMNDVFLSALLMYAAIEGIQSCFHVHHLIDQGGKSILLQHKLTYPALLMGFACIGILMRAVLNTVHELRDDENAQKSVTDARGCCSDEPRTKCPDNRMEGLVAQNNSQVHSGVKANFQGDTSLSQLSVKQIIDSSQETNGIVLKSFKTSMDELDDKMASVYIPTESAQGNYHRSTMEASVKRLRFIKHTVSPSALFVCALVVYFVTYDLALDIIDAVLAILVVVVAYIASYPAMDYSGRILLQTAPMDLNLNTLTADLESISPLVTSVDELHVWSLTNDGRIGSCNLNISKDHLKDDKEVADILHQAKSRFLSHGVKCSSVQPVLYSAIEKIAAAAQKTDQGTGCSDQECHRLHED